MADNLQQSVEVPVGLSLFGGLVTEMSPSDLPEGTSPSCNDVIFLPGSVSSRPGVHKLGYNFPAGLTITYQKTFIRPDAVKMNLFLTSDGTLWVENVTDGPYVVTKLASVAPGSYANSMTAFGKEYLAFHDGVNGTDIPRQFDGTFFDRVTQCGPGAPPSLSNSILQASNLQSSSSANGPFVIIPVQGGGGVAVGTGQGPTGLTIPLPAGYTAANMVAWATASNGWDRNTQVVGLFSATVSALGVVDAFFEDRTGAQSFAASVNWAAAAWTTTASVVVTTVGGVTYVAFTTANGDDVVIVNGVLTTGSPAITVPGGFSIANFAYIVGPATTDTFTHGLQGVNACTLTAGSKVLTYQDGSSHTWSGSVNVFGMFYKTSGGITASAVTNGNAVLIPDGNGGTISMIYGTMGSGSSFGLPSGFSGIVSSTCAMSGYTLSGQTFICHGWPYCQMQVMGFLGSYLDGQGNSWPGMGNFFAVALGGAPTGTSLARINNTVTATTIQPHNMEVGYLAQVSGVIASEIGNGIVGIQIDNENEPGVATVTTNTAHGLLPQNNITITGVPSTIVGGNIVSITREGQVVTVVTQEPHGLVPGAVPSISGVTDVSFNGTFVIQAVTSDTSFTYIQDDVDATSSGGTVNLNWPIPDTTTPTFFQVVSSPTPNTFQIQIDYTDGTWNGGTIQFSWNGQFFVTKIDSPTVFEYQQYGPDITTPSTGIITPFGQAAPGLRNCVLMFETRQGFITAPSPPTLNFITNGGQYILAEDVAIGPPNTIRRILAFTGAGGANYFFIPVPAQINGLVVSTSTTIEDNTTTSVLLDFSDNTLFDSTAIDIPGNNLFDMAVLGPCLGPFNYASRSAWWGQKNDIQNLLNLGFEGGFQTGNPNVPLGWTVNTPGGTLITDDSDSGFAWQMAGDGGVDSVAQLQQDAFQDYLGIPVFEQSHQYAVSFWSRMRDTLSPTGQVVIKLNSVSLGYSSTATVEASQLTDVGRFFTLNFTQETPAFLPSDLVLQVYSVGVANGASLIIDEIQIIDAETPQALQFLFSYVEKPEQLDLVSGLLGATDDSTPIQVPFTFRDGMRFLTQRGLHEVQDIDSSEPSGWPVRQVTNNCGACGPRSCASGENFSVWVTSPSANPPVGRGLYVYTGGEVFKLSQEIQPDFDAVNDAAATSIWVEVDSVIRRIYIGMPVANGTAPNIIYVLDYRELDTASDLASRGPIHISFTGKMICSDLSRKWAPWNLSMNCGKVMFFSGIGTQMSFGNGNGQTPGQSPGFSGVYWLDSAKLTDDDFGLIMPQYTTYFFLNHDMESSLQVGLHRKLFKRYDIYIQGTGNLRITPYANTLTNPWPSPPDWPMSQNQLFDLGDGLNVSTERCAFKLASIPLVGQTDNQFNVGKLIITLMQEPVSPIRFGAV